MPQVWALIGLLVVSAGLGALPFVEWSTWLVTGRHLRRLGTGNVSVSAAFYHGGQAAGILAVCAEAFKGIASVLLARWLFPTAPVMELVALMALVTGRYFGGRGAGTTNVVWGYLIHDWRVAGLTALIGGISFTLLRDRTIGKYSVLALLPLLTILRYPHQGDRIVAVMLLAGLLALVYTRIPDDLDLPKDAVQEDSSRVFRFFRGDRSLRSLDQPLEPNQVGQKAATLSQIKRWGFAVPTGWVLPPGDDPTPLFEAIHPCAAHPVVVRSSAIGEDTETASAAGQYDSFLDITSRPALEQAVLRCQGSYNSPGAVRYRQARQIPEDGMAVIVQQQITGVFSGVAFSRDPIQRQGNAVVLEALPGGASRVVSGRVTPEQYRVYLSDSGDTQAEKDLGLDTEQSFVEGEGDVPRAVIRQAAVLARDLERRYHGVPQDVEWVHDGQQIWVVQTRPITTLRPIWTRKIAAEVIPGFIPPLTWSINRPLTCGVWGTLFTVVLGDRATGLDFTETATLHHSAAYFNATLLGDLFRRMGLPAESLEFLTLGASFGKPPLMSTLQNVPGLLRLLRREWHVAKDFEQDDRQQFQPELTALRTRSPEGLSPEALLHRVDHILNLLELATYYNILAPLSFALRRSLLRVDEATLNTTQMPEVAAVRTLQHLAQQARQVLGDATLPQASDSSSPGNWANWHEQLAQMPEGQPVLAQLGQFMDDYGYLGQVTTDISIPRWRETPDYVIQLVAQFMEQPLALASEVSQTKGIVQRRLALKGRVAEVYNRLLAELRWSLLALAQQWCDCGWIEHRDDLFFLELNEIRELITGADDGSNRDLKTSLPQRIAARRQEWESDRQQANIPSLVYGNAPPPPLAPPPALTARQLRGIGASVGIVEGEVLIVRQLADASAIRPNTIIVVPYTDAGWAPLLSRASGILSEVGGRLSHGAIVAREYGIPAVMNITEATRQLRNGQRIRLNGETGIVELL
ncbi:MAG: glycerol-3-phosphate acyltransferase [Kaiparowitsia implicata GSE-PSE-MK54-09C]|jgi:pyruvate,water dikinase|nr:glycerol-3-phosphate acyltransferase [Kaiparowitsia implicata GSE-PSE-MK54-09C]